MAVDFQIPYTTISVGKGDKAGSFTVRGLDAEDVVFLTTTYHEDLKNIVADYGKTSTNGRIATHRIGELVIAIVQRFPLLTAEIISRCADAPGELEKFRRLPFVKQVEAVKAILELSSEGDDQDLLKKAGQALVSLLEANGLQLGALTKQLQTIIGTSANQ